MTTEEKRQQVRQQLQQLGYEDVPEDVLDEFVQELQLFEDDLIPQNQDSLAQSSFSAQLPVDTSSMQSPLSEEEVRRHLQTLGYEDVPEEFVQELVQELKEWKGQRTTSISPKATNWHQKDWSEIRSAIQSEQRKQSSPRRPWTMEELELGLDDLSTATVRDRAPRSKPVPRTAPRPATSTSTSRRTSTQRPAKCDPVQRYHQYNSIWKQDTFLRRQVDPKFHRKALASSTGFDTGRS